MSSLTYTTDPTGPGQQASETYHYSQSVILPSGIVKSQIDLAFANVDRVLQSHGLRGWEDVYLWRSYAVGMDEAMQYLVPKIRERVPAHRPVWTALSVPRLGLEKMLIEIEVEAFAPLK
ncbi:uncharacterized protein N7443_002236 [Penicillium atrosanguineum]|uniref:YjgF-like protein n=1 Tax=Penicillium atrosanguineum TaxID=1132637 RepID=A0A9W9PVZ8_9EURO|nr:uncharacterized protein N7443_002236 [Penicillium atrosanguineum]KAJ5122133.1 YjgF-like protein [Penicillium atrosanguineum]KAJ5309775.1 hypothetical protein N7443_002236 [Penicillium atrosanguineum]KAJ5315295.1 YjgF-like protein [Penicillium atrosanguineum]